MVWVDIKHKIASTGSLNYVLILFIAIVNDTVGIHVRIFELPENILVSLVKAWFTFTFDIFNTVQKFCVNLKNVRVLRLIVKIQSGVANLVAKVDHGLKG